MHDLKETITQMIDSKFSASIAAFWAFLAGWLQLSNVAVFCSILLTCIMIVRQAIGLRKDLRGDKDASDI